MRSFSFSLFGLSLAFPAVADNITPRLEAGEAAGDLKTQSGELAAAAVNVERARGLKRFYRQHPRA